MEKHTEVETQEGRRYGSHIVDLLQSPSGSELYECALFKSRGGGGLSPLHWK